jgi:hypothetical protein
VQRFEHLIVALPLLPSQLQPSAIGSLRTPSSP